MAPKPAAPLIWDSGLVNTAAPTGGQITSGWGLNSPLASSTLNFIVNLLGQYSQYIDSGKTGVVRKIAATRGALSWSTAPTVSPFNNIGEFVPNFATDLFRIDIPLDVGETLTRVDTNVYHVALGYAWNAKLYKRNMSDISPSPTPVQIGSTQTSSGGAGDKTLSFTGLSETVVGSDIFTYYVQFSITGSGALGAMAVEGITATVNVPF